MAVRLPGGVMNTDDFWDLMINKKSGLIPIPKSRWNIDGSWSAEPQWGTIQNRDCYMFDSQVQLNTFDTSFFTCGKLESDRMDPMQRQLLEITKECLDSAGESRTRGEDVGCYVGTFSSDWQDDQSMDPHASGIYRGSGYLDFFQPNRISYEYGWTGPSLLIKTGCSSSMVALHLAAEAVKNNSCTSAMALGCNIMSSVMTSIVFTETGVLSPSGKCKTFDSLADGYGRGEAVNAVYIKKLSHALRDGNPIRAIIRGSGTNNDGRSQGIMTPSDIIQEKLIRQVYKNAGISDVSKTAFFECHGTGTPTGDPLEASAVARIWGPQGGVLMGAVKPNVGHSEGAAGLTSVIKAVLALEHKLIPPNIYLEDPSPRIPWGSAHLRVPTEPESWPLDRHERVSVNSFGVSGSNAHVIIDSYNSYESRRSCRTPESETDSGVFIPDYPSNRLLLFSASHTESLDKQVQLHKAYLEKHPAQADNLAYTLAFHREHLAYRSYVVTDAHGGFEMGMIPKSTSKVKRQLVFVYTGQGAHWAGMGRSLITSNEAFRASIQKLDKFLQSLPEPPSWTLQEELMKEDQASSKVGQRGYSHPCATAVQIALTGLLFSLGVRPDAVTAHSGGEAAAAYATGSITAEAAMAIAYFRGVVIKGDNVPKGTMAAVSLGPKAVEPFLVPGVVIGCENSQLSTTLSGDPICIQHCVDQIGRRHPDVKYKILNLETSFHSPWLQPLTGIYRELMRPYVRDTKSPSCPHFSSVTGQKITTDEFGLEYWVDNFLLPVKFNTAVRNILASDSNTAFIEIGPHPALRTPVKEILRDFPGSSCEYVTTLERQQGSNHSLLILAGRLFSLNMEVDLGGIIPKGRVIPDLPTYPWHHNAVHWYEPRNAARFKQRQYPRHSLLGSRVLEGNDIEPAWRNMLDLKEASWLFDHVVNGSIVYPATAYVAMVGEAMRQVSGGVLPYTVRHVSFPAGLVLSKDKRVELYTRLIPDDTTEDGYGATWYNFKIMSSDGNHWVSHCTGNIRSGVDTSTAQEKLVASGHNKARNGLARHIDSDPWYRGASKIGIDWNGIFRGLENMTASVTAKEAAASVFDSYEDTVAYAAHPALLDQLLQVNLVALTNGLLRDFDKIHLPTRIERLAVFADQELQMRVFAEATDSASECDHVIKNKSYQAVMLSEEGSPIAVLEGLSISELPVPKRPGREHKLLGSYFACDTDLTMVDSISCATTLDLDSDTDQTMFTHYRYIEEIRRAAYLFGWKYPDAEILEVGDGTLDVSSAVLGALRPDHRRRYFKSYTYACTDSEAIGATEAHLAAEGLDGGVVVGAEDMSLVGKGADLVIASLSSLIVDDELVQEELEELGTMLRPWGRIIVHYHPTDSEDLDRMRQLACQRLEELGFIVHSSTNAGLTFAQLPEPAPLNQTVTLLTTNDDHGILAAGRVSHVFEKHGCKAKTVFGMPDTTDPGDTIIISLLDLHSPTFHDLDEETFRPFMARLAGLRGSLVWVTPTALTHCKDPRTAMGHGVVRTARMESGVDVTIVEVDEPSRKSDSFGESLWKISQSLPSRRSGGILDADFDYVITDGVVQIPRVQWFDLHDPQARDDFRLGRESASRSEEDHTPVGLRESPGERNKLSLPSSLFRSDATYVLVGGTGGIGRSVATWMAENGAQSFIFLSRSAASPEHEPFLSELESYPNCRVQAVSGDVSIMADVERALALAPGKKPVAGVIQLSLVLSDNGLKTMTFDEWQKTIKPRVHGTWNIHKATEALQLDFFLVFGSGGGITGYFGQANYSASNTYLDALVEYRHGLGLPASLIDVGVVGDMGYLTDNDRHSAAFRSAGYLFLTERDVLDAAAVAVRHSHDRGPLHSFFLGAVPEIPLEDPGNRINWKRDVRFALAHTLFGAGESTKSRGWPGRGNLESETLDNGFSVSELADLAASDPNNPKWRDPATVDSLAHALCEALAEILMQPVDGFSVGARLPSLGLDSIVSIELVDWIQRQFRVSMTSIEVTQCSSLLHLSGNVLEKLISSSP
ncbi:hypothetical protein KVR01_012184 [Diaporthe batatas]|uniref:uncharacterized protein n=1 Tax=Diaporthe batatas TaxID=748121 RepID=UPI001D058388|nr:uncharacterized protein KVR01_012184 [Diaporthe batatas]KAG8157912.1 hypothetical protein KVR01_012184 [Diaporthe batatas]